jgi:RNA polymerase sigma-70 factor (ECF subfamily)
VHEDTLDRAVAGERQAQAAVLEESYAYIHRLLCRLVGHDADLDDLRQTVLVQVLRGLPSFRKESSLSTWIGGICVNTVKAHRRDRRRRAQRYVPAESVDELPALSSAHTTLESRERLERALHVLATMSLAQRTVYVLRMVYGHSIEEIAAMTGAACSTTRLRLYYGRRKFFKSMAATPKRRATAARWSP